MSTRRVLCALLLLLGVASGASAAEITHRVEIIFFDDYDQDGIWDANTEPQVGNSVINCNRSTYHEGTTDASLYGMVVMKSQCSLNAICDYSVYDFYDGFYYACLTESFATAIGCNLANLTCP